MSQPGQQLHLNLSAEHTAAVRKAIASTARFWSGDLTILRDLFAEGIIPAKTYGYDNGIRLVDRSSDEFLVRCASFEDTLRSLKTLVEANDRMPDGCVPDDNWYAVSARQLDDVLEGSPAADGEPSVLHVPHVAAYAVRDGIDLYWRLCAAQVHDIKDWANGVAMPSGTPIDGDLIERIWSTVRDLENATGFAWGHSLGIGHPLTVPDCSLCYEALVVLRAGIASIDDPSGSMRLHTNVHDGLTVRYTQSDRPTVAVVPAVDVSVRAAPDLSHSPRF